MKARYLYGDPARELAELPEGTAHACVTRAPALPEDVFSELKRVLRPEGTLWISGVSVQAAMHLLDLGWLLQSTVGDSMVFSLDPRPYYGGVRQRMPGRLAPVTPEIHQALDLSNSMYCCARCSTQMQKDGAGRWQRGCSCPGDLQLESCVVLDPFTADGKVGAYALSALRSFIGINPDLGADEHLHAIGLGWTLEA